MSTLREAAQQALEALENTSPAGWSMARDKQFYAAITDLRAALAQQEQEQEQEPVAYTGDVARKMREAGMTFHLGMPHAAVMEQMTRFHDLVCAEASIKAAAAFAIPPRRETEQQEQEPVTDLRCAFWLDPECADAGACQSLKFKANPPRREWVSLTEEEVWSQYQTLWPLPVASDTIRRLQFRKFARSVEQALKEKNHE